MTGSIPISKLTIWSLAIPMRRKFKHAAAEREVAEPIVVELELADRTIGYGETHARTYVTGESDRDVLATIHEFVPALVEARPANFGEAMELAAGLPLTGKQGRPITAARAAVELALLDAYSRAFERSLDSLAGWLDEAWLGEPGSRATARFGGVVSGMDPRRVPWSIRKMRLLRLPHFKLKVGDRDDGRRVDAALRTLHRGLESGRITLRLDANGAWNVDEAGDRLARWQDLPIVSVEQPLPKSAKAAAWGELACRTTLPLMADESLVTYADAEALIAAQGASWFNIRISKNGGLFPALRMASLARRNQVEYQLGCMVGETSILSAAGRWFLQLVPGVHIAEGSFGKFLLEDDVVARSMRFGFGGRWKPMTGSGLGVTVEPERLRRFALVPPIEIPF